MHIDLPVSRSCVYFMQDHVTAAVVYLVSISSACIANAVGMDNNDHDFLINFKLSMSPNKIANLLHEVTDFVFCLVYKAKQLVGDRGITGIGP